MYVVPIPCVFVPKKNIVVGIRESKQFPFRWGEGGGNSRLFTLRVLRRPTRENSHVRVMPGKDSVRQRRLLEVQFLQRFTGGPNAPQSITLRKIIQICTSVNIPASSIYIRGTYLEVVQEVDWDDCVALLTIRQFSVNHTGSSLHRRRRGSRSMYHSGYRMCGSPDTTRRERPTKTWELEAVGSLGSDMAGE